MFCPNCGAQNLDTATACAKCGFALKPATAAPKFKGTMLMMNAPPAAVPRPAAPAGPAPGAAPPAPAQAAPAAQAPGPAAPAPAGPKPKLKGTMIGVAPPSLGSNSPPVPGMGARAPVPAQPAMPPGGGYGAPAPMPPGGTAAMATPPAAVAPPQQPAAAVNPLGGTVVADAGAFGGAGFPAAPGGAQGPGGYDIGAPPPGFGAPPPGFAQPPGGYGAPPQGSDPSGFGATAQSAGGAAPMVPAPQGGMAPMDMDEPLPPIPGTVGGANPIVTVLLIVFTCGIYGIYLLVKGKKAPVE